MTSTERYILDTNFVLRYLLRDEEDQFKKANQFFEEVKVGRKKAVLKEFVITEVIFVLTSFYRVPKSEIARSINGLILYKGIVMEDKSAFAEALNLYEESSKLHIVDCILAAYSKSQTLQLMTFDKDLLKCIGRKS